MANVLVLSVNKADGRVAINNWGNNGTYSSFTTEPKNFVVRRLIKFTGDINPETNNYDISKFGEIQKVSDYWDPFIFQPEILAAKLDLGIDNENSK